MLIKITSTVVELSAFGAALSVTDEMMEYHLSLPVLRISDCPRYNITIYLQYVGLDWNNFWHEYCPL